MNELPRRGLFGALLLLASGGAAEAQYYAYRGPPRRVVRYRNIRRFRFVNGRRVYYYARVPY